LAPASRAAEPKPLATIAVISNPYITKLPAKEIVDERGSVRDFLAKTAEPSLTKSVELVNALKPDAFVVLGSLTWSGSDADLATVSEQLDKVEVPLMLTPGHRDGKAEGFKTYLKHFPKRDVSNSVQTINDVQLVFANDLHGNPDESVERMTTQLQSGGGKGVVVFAGKESEFSRSKLTPTHRFWEFVEHHKVAAQLDPTRYGHQTLYSKSLPIWTVGSSGWSARGAVTLVRVFEDRVELSEVRSASEPTFGLSVPNPVTQPRMNTAEQDEYGSPSFTENLTKKPEFTFALVSDPQFDRERGRETLIQRAKKAIAELNVLKPELVFVSGDLVNNNLPEEWKIFNEIFADLKPRRIVVPGNHDVLFNYDFVEASYSSAPQKRPDYAAIVKQALAGAAKEGFKGPTALYEKYTGSKPHQLVEHRDCAFITTPLLTMRADPAEIQHLREHLEKTGKHRHVFVVSHYPSLSAFGNNIQPQLGGTEILGLLHQHRVTGFLFGHRHRNGFKIHERTAHVLSDNMGSIHLFHVFPDRIVIGRKRVGAALYETITLTSNR